MIFKFTLSGKVKNSNKSVTQYVSVPHGITQEQFLSKVEAFRKAFTQVKATADYTE